MAGLVVSPHSPQPLSPCHPGAVPLHRDSGAIQSTLGASVESASEQQIRLESEDEHSDAIRTPGQATYFHAFSDGSEGKPREVNLLSLTLDERLTLHRRWVRRSSNTFELAGCRLPARLVKVGQTVFFRHVRMADCNKSKYHGQALHDAFQNALLSILQGYGLVASREEWTNARDARSDILAYTSRGRSISIEIQRSGQTDVVTDRRTEARMADVDMVVWIWNHAPAQGIRDTPDCLNLVYNEDAEDPLEVRFGSNSGRGGFHAGHGLAEALSCDSMFYHSPPSDASAAFASHWCGLTPTCPADGSFLSREVHHSW